MVGDDGRDGHHLVIRRAPAAWGFEAVWRDHGEALLRLARTRLGGSARADAACFAVLVRAGRWVEITARPIPTERVWPWLRRLCVEVCDEIARHGVDPARVTRGPLPDSLPRPLHERLRLLASRQDLDFHEDAVAVPGPIARARRRDRARWRAAFQRRLHELPVVVAVPRLARRAWEGVDRAGRGTWRRAEAAASTAVPSGQRAAGLFTAGPGLPEAAAIITAVVAVGMVGPSDGPTGRDVEPPPASRSHAPLVAGTSLDRLDRLALPEPEPSPPVEPPPTLEAPPERPDPPAPQPAPEVSKPEIAPTATVTADPEETVNEPITQQRAEGQDGTWYYVSPGIDASADADGDGEDDVFFSSPQTGWSCAPPGEQGTTGGVVCPALEESGLPSKPRKG